MKKRLLIFVVAIACIIPAIQAGIVNSSVLFYMPANGTAGTGIFNDLSTNAFTLTNKGNVVIAQSNGSAKFNNASFFNGTTNSIIWGPPSVFTQVGTTYPWSLAFWFNSTSSTTWNCLIGNRNASGRVDGEFCFGTRTNAGNQLLVDLRYGGADAYQISSTNYNDGIWHYAVVTRTNATNIQTFVDGVKKLDFNINSASYMGNAARNLTIGYNAVDNTYYTGYIDDLVFYNNSYINGTVIPTIEFINTASTAIPPVASFAASNTSGVYPPSLPVRFTDTSTNTPTSWQWNATNVTGNNTPFTFATTQNPIWYFDIGNYSISLNATNADGSDISDQVTWINVSAPTSLSLAEFTGSPLSGTAPLSVTFTDADGTGETSWFWMFGDGNTTGNTEQNPVHLYTLSGTYTVNHSATNVIGTNWTNKTGYITVVNASAFTPQDVWMEGQYNVTVHVITTSGIPLANAAITTSNGLSGVTNTLGYTYITEPFGLYTFSSSLTGYSSQIRSVIVDEDMTVTFQMVTSTSSTPYNVKYPPKDVRFHAQTASGAPLPLVWVTATPYHTPLGSYEYVATLFGYDLDAVPLQSMELNGSTDSHGDITFAMMTDTQYYVTGAKTGYTFTSLNITPHDDNYLLTADHYGSLFVTNGTAPAADITFDTEYSRINLTTGVINLSVVDTTGVATGGVFNITQKNTTAFNSTIPIQIANFTFTGNQSMANFTLVDIAGVAGCPSSTSAIYNTSGSLIGCFNKTLVDDSSYQTSCKVNTPSGTVYETGIVWFKKMASPIAGLSPEFALFCALSIMMFTALMAAGPSSAPPMSIVVCFEGWVFYGLNMFVLLEGVTKSGMPIVPVVLTFMTFIAIVFNFTEYRRKNK